MGACVVVVVVMELTEGAASAGNEGTSEDTEASFCSLGPPWKASKALAVGMKWRDGGGVKEPSGAGLDNGNF